MKYSLREKRNARPGKTSCRVYKEKRFYDVTLLNSYIFESSLFIWSYYSEHKFNNSSR